MKENQMEKMEKKSFGRRKGCRFCIETELKIDYKDRYMLQSFITERSKIIPRRMSGLCSIHQRGVTNALKRARHLAILSYSSAQL